MTAQEKAKELVEKFKRHALANWENYNLKQCALITVDEILYNVLILADERKIYWQQVKEEIEKL